MCLVLPVFFGSVVLYRAVPWCAVHWCNGLGLVGLGRAGRVLDAVIPISQLEHILWNPHKSVVSDVVVVLRCCGLVAGRLVILCGPSDPR